MYLFQQLSLNFSNLRRIKLYAPFYTKVPLVQINLSLLPNPKLEFGKMSTLFRKKKLERSFLKSEGIQLHYRGTCKEIHYFEIRLLA